MTWQQIESAPGDGENILVTDGDLIYLVARYNSEWRDAWSGQVIFDYSPTHWLSLPKLPK